MNPRARNHRNRHKNNVKYQSSIRLRRTNECQMPNDLMSNSKGLNLAFDYLTLDIHLRFDI